MRMVEFKKSTRILFRANKNKTYSFNNVLKITEEDLSRDRKTYMFDY